MESYPFSLAWRGSTLEADFNRDAIATAPAKAGIPMSAGMAPGDLSRWNPEDMLGASLAMCHTLTFLALAAKVKLDVRSIDGQNEAILEAVERIKQVTKIILRPHIVLAAGSDVAKAEEMYEKAHKYCYIANSIKATIEMKPTFELQSGS